MAVEQGRRIMTLRGPFSLLGFTVCTAFLGIQALAPAQAQPDFPSALLRPLPPSDDPGAAAVSPFLPGQAPAVSDRILAERMRQMVGRRMARDTGPQAEVALALARHMLERGNIRLDRRQALLVVDRAPAVQRLFLVIASPDGSWRSIGAVHVSTGKPGRKEHFKTPVGIFTNGPAILGYRAQGTLNEHGIRGIGTKGMRVWDFGWQTTEDWRTQGAVTSVRLEMHATDPTFLESRLGRPDSEACIRVPDGFNRFLDQYGVIDGALTPLVPSDRAIAALLPKNATPYPDAGDTVVVVDSSEPDATPSDPVLAENIQRRFAEWLAAQAAPAPGGATAPVVPSQHVPTVPVNANAANASAPVHPVLATPSL